MAQILSLLATDIRFHEALTSCMNCGVCTAICPAAEFYKYDPRQICNLVQQKNENEITQLLKTDTIWYCGECMSCLTRCPRGNKPGLLIMSLRKVSQELGYFVESEKGRQQYVIRKVIGGNIINTGYCVHPDIVTPENHPEQGPVWKWYIDNIEDLSARFGANYHGAGAGALKTPSEENMNEIRKIFEATGAMEYFGKIDEYSEERRRKENQSEEDYIAETYTTNNNEHAR